MQLHMIFSQEHLGKTCFECLSHSNHEAAFIFQPGSFRQKDFERLSHRSHEAAFDFEPGTLNKTFLLGWMRKSYLDF